MKFLVVTLLWFTVNANPVPTQDSCEGETLNGQRDGTWTCYYDDGTVQQEGIYEAGKKVGEWTYYHTNGQVALKGIYNADVEKGKWQVYDDAGSMVDEIDYGD